MFAHFCTALLASFMQNAVMMVRSFAPGILSQFNLGKPNTQIAQFFICLAPCPHFDGKYAAFGKVIEGMEIVRKAGEWGSASGQPSKKVEIADCGEVATESGAAVSTSSPVPAAAASAPASAAKAAAPTAAKASEPAPGAICTLLFSVVNRRFVC